MWDTRSWNDQKNVRSNMIFTAIKRIEVYILTDRNSFSSAMLFSQMLQDNGLGQVIGEPPANKVNSYGDIAS